MQETEWLWNELRDIYRVPETYILRKDAFNWMCYTSTFVESLREFVLPSTNECGELDLTIWEEDPKNARHRHGKSWVCSG